MSGLKQKEQISTCSNEPKLKTATSLLHSSCNTERRKPKSNTSSNTSTLVLTAEFTLPLISMEPEQVACQVRDLIFKTLRVFFGHHLLSLTLSDIQYTQSIQVKLNQE